jgi:hypothetical protein
MQVAVYEDGPPPPMQTLHRFGSPRDLITAMCDYLPDFLPADGHGAPVQRTMAALLGVTQQSISRYINACTEPDLPDIGWQQLARLAWAWTEWPDKAADFATVRRILTGAWNPPEGLTA